MIGNIEPGNENADLKDPKTNEGRKNNEPFKNEEYENDSKDGSGETNNDEGADGLDDDDVSLYEDDLRDK